MKRNNGIILLLISVAVTTLGSMLKVMRLITLSEILLWIGAIAFLVAIAMLIYKIFDKKTKGV